LTKHDIRALVAEVPLFDGLTGHELDRLAASAGHAHLADRANLISLSQPGDIAYFILKGTLRVQVEEEDGSLVILAFLGAGDLVGEMSVLDRDARSATVVSVEPCELLWLDRATLEDALRAMPAMAHNLLRLLSRRLRLANERILALSTLDVRGRVARQLAALADAYGPPGGAGAVTIPLRLTDSDVAALVGASRERVNQVMGEMRDRGLIVREADHRISVRNREDLASRYG